MSISGPAGWKLSLSCFSRSSGILGRRRRQKDVASTPRSSDANLDLKVVEDDCIQFGRNMGYIVPNVEKNVNGVSQSLKYTVRLK